METTTEKHVEILNDLIQINNDRIEGYERAIKETEDKDADLKALFAGMGSDSRQYNTELTSLVQDHGGDVATGTTGSGKIYRIWMDVKATFSGNDRKAILSNCEFGEDAAQKAYKEALADENLNDECRAVVSNQQQALKGAHDKIKALRDAQS